MSNNPNPGGVIGPAFGKGCLLGLGLVVLFAAISGLLWLALLLTDLPENIRLLISIATGPILGTVIGLFVAWRMMNRRQA